MLLRYGWAHKFEEIRCAVPGRNDRQVGRERFEMADPLAIGQGRRHGAPTLIRGAILAAVLASLSGLVGACRAEPLGASPTASLVLERTIPLEGVEGRIDHMAIDLRRQRLFVAAVANGSVEAIDLATGVRVGRITGLSAPQGIAVLPEAGEFAVATGGDGALRFYDADDLRLAATVEVGGDADNVRFDQANSRVLVGSDDLVAIDPSTRTITARTPLPAHAEGFQVDRGRVFVNTPDAGVTAVAEPGKPRLISSWANAGRRWNYPLAIDSSAHEIAIVFRLPARLVIRDQGTGFEKQALATCGDADDVFFDAKRGRLYVACGSGEVAAYERTSAGFKQVGSIKTAKGARTALWNAELDRLFVAAPSRLGRPADILVYRPGS